MMAAAVWGCGGARMKVNPEEDVRKACPASVVARIKARRRVGVEQASTSACCGQRPAEVTTPKLLNMVLVASFSTHGKAATVRSAGRATAVRRPGTKGFQAITSHIPSPEDKHHWTSRKCMCHGRAVLASTPMLVVAYTASASSWNPARDSTSAACRKFKSGLNTRELDGPGVRRTRSAGGKTSTATDTGT